MTSSLPLGEYYAQQNFGVSPGSSPGIKKLPDAHEGGHPARDHVGQRARPGCTSLRFPRSVVRAEDLVVAGAPVTQLQALDHELWSDLDMERGVVHESDRKVEAAVLEGMANPVHLLATDFLVLATKLLAASSDSALDPSVLLRSPRGHWRATNPHNLLFLLSRHRGPPNVGMKASAIFGSLPKSG